MGKEQSKVVDTENTQAGEVNNSEGFHLFEIHIATASFNAGLTILLIVLTIIGYYLLQRCFKKRASSRGPYYQPMAPAPHPPIPPPLPQPLNFPMQQDAPRVVYINERPRRCRHRDIPPKDEERIQEVEDYE